MTMLRPPSLVAFLLLCPLLLCPLLPQRGAAAQPLPGTVPVAATEESRREAHALGDMLQYPARAQTIVAQMRLSAVRAAAQASGKPPEEAARIVDEIVMPDFKDVQAQVEALLVENLATAFTAADLRQLRNFFNSPLGQRWIKTIPSFERDNLRQIQLLGQKTFNDSIGKHADELRTRGIVFSAGHP